MTSDPSLTGGKSYGTDVTTQLLLAVEEKVLLQVAVVPLQIPDGKVTVTAWILLDSTSQSIFMTNQSAIQLNFTSEHKEVLSVPDLVLRKPLI